MRRDSDNTLDDARSPRRPAQPDALDRALADARDAARPRARVRGVALRLAASSRGSRGVRSGAKSRPSAAVAINNPPPRASAPRPRFGPRPRSGVLSRAVSAPPPGGPETTEEDIDDAFKPSELGIKDIISLWVTQILQTYGDEESKDGAPVCEGSVDDLVGAPIFIALYPYFLKYGGVFKLAFGPKVFMVLSDPVVVREVLKNRPFAFTAEAHGRSSSRSWARTSSRRRTRCGRTGGCSLFPGFTRPGSTTWWVCSGIVRGSS